MEILKTKVFALYPGKITDLAIQMGLSRSYLYRVRAGEREIGNQFIVGALKLFPCYSFGELFYIE